MFALFSGYVMNRRNFSRLLAFVLVVGLVLTTAYIISAQQDDRRERFRQRRQMDSEAMTERMVERMMRELNLSEEETAVLKLKIEGIVQTRVKQIRLNPIGFRFLQDVFDRYLLLLFGENVVYS